MQLQKPPTSDAHTTAVPADSLADAWSTTVTTAVPAPAAGRDFVAGAWSLKPPAAGPGDATPAATSQAAPVDDDQAVGLRQAHECHLPDITLAALRYARVNDRTFPKPVDKRGAELLHCVGGLKKWPATGPVPRPGPPASTDRPGPPGGREPGPVRSGRHDPRALIEVLLLSRHLPHEHLVTGLAAVLPASPQP